MWASGYRGATRVLAADAAAQLAGGGGRARARVSPPPPAPHAAAGMPDGAQRGVEHLLDCMLVAHYVHYVDDFL